VVGISTLAAMAQQAYMQNQSVHVTAAIDARMSEVYFGRYQLEQNVMALVGIEQVLPPVEAVQILSHCSEIAGVGTGWQAYPELGTVEEVEELPDILYPDALFMLPLAKDLIANGYATAVEEIQPVYLRDKVTWKKLPGKE